MEVDPVNLLESTPCYKTEHRTLLLACVKVTYKCDFRP